MGNPLRFYGAGQELEIDGITIPGRCSVEVTFRCVQQQFLLRPDKEATEIILGCLGRAYHRYPGVNLHVVSVLSKHGCFLATPENPAILSEFMRDFLSTVAKKLNTHRDRRGTFWERRYRAIPTIDTERCEERFAYVLTQGTKENLLASARDWPGVSSARALLGGPRLVGRWRDRTTECELHRQARRRRGRAAAGGRTIANNKVPQVWLEYPIELHPLPHWRDLKPGQRRAIVAQMIADDDEQTRSRHQNDGTKPLGVRAILAQHPHDRPQAPKHSPAPLCHARSRRQRTAFRKAHAAYVEMYRGCASTLQAQVPVAGFPAGTITPIFRYLAPRRPPSDRQPSVWSSATRPPHSRRTNQVARKTPNPFRPRKHAPVAPQHRVRHPSVWPDVPAIPLSARSSPTPPGGHDSSPARFAKADQH